MSLPQWLQHATEFADAPDSPPPPWLLKENYESDLKWLDDIIAVSDAGDSQTGDFWEPPSLHEPGSDQSLPSSQNDFFRLDASLFAPPPAVLLESEPSESAAATSPSKNSQEPDILQINWNNDDSEEVKKEKLIRRWAASVASEAIKQLYGMAQKDDDHGSMSKQATRRTIGRQRKFVSSSCPKTVANSGDHEEEVVTRLSRVHDGEEEEDGAEGSACEPA